MTGGGSPIMPFGGHSQSILSTTEHDRGWRRILGIFDSMDNRIVDHQVPSVPRHREFTLRCCDPDRLLAVKAVQAVSRRAKATFNGQRHFQHGTFRRHCVPLLEHVDFIGPHIDGSGHLWPILAQRGLCVTKR